MILVTYGTNPNQLYHHGIKGQRWGVRRYQNPDGSLTPAGKQKQLKELSGKKAITISGGTTMHRVSTSKNDDAKNRDKLYVNLDDNEKEVYKMMLGSSGVLKTGKAYVHKYTNNTDIKIPSEKLQTKIERNLLKDPEARADIIESLVNKGYSREAAAKVTKRINMGAEVTKIVLSTALSLPFGGIGGLSAVASTREKIRRQDSFIRVSMGDEKAKNLNKRFESELSKRGYNAYRDTNDKYNSVRAKNSIVLINPSKIAKMTEQHQLTKAEYGKAVAAFKLKENKNKLPNGVSLNDWQKDAEKEFEDIKKLYVDNKKKKNKKKIKDVVDEHDKAFGK